MKNIYKFHFFIMDFKLQFQSEITFEIFFSNNNWRLFLLCCLTSSKKTFFSHFLYSGLPFSGDLSVSIIRFVRCYMFQAQYGILLSLYRTLVILVMINRKNCLNIVVSLLDDFQKWFPKLRLISVTLISVTHKQFNNVFVQLMWKFLIVIGKPI